MSPFYWSTGGSPFDWTTGAVDDQQVVTVLTGGAAPPPPNGAPYAASGLTATAGNGQVNLSWTAGSGATSYNLYRAAETGFEGTNPVVTGITGTSYTDTNLNSGTTYYYQVVAVNSSGRQVFHPRPARQPPASTRTRRNSTLKPTRRVGRQAAVTLPEWRLQPRSTMRAGSRWL